MTSYMENFVASTCRQSLPLRLTFYTFGSPLRTIFTVTDSVQDTQKYLVKNH